jgi:hypothetical protein
VSGEEVCALLRREEVDQFTDGAPQAFDGALRYLSLTSTRDLAKSYGVSRSTIARLT